MLDKDGAKECLTMQGKCLAAASGKDGLHSGVDSEGMGGWLRIVLTPMSSRRSLAESSYSGRESAAEDMPRHTNALSLRLGPRELEV